VRSDKQAGYVAVKVYGRLSKDVYNAIVVAARREGLPVVGHVPSAVGLGGAIAARQDSIEHLDSFLPLLAPDDAAGQNTSLSGRLQQPDFRRLPAVVQAIKAANAWICPTLVVTNLPRTDAAWLEQVSFVPPAVFERYKRMYPDLVAGKDPRATLQAHAAYLAILAALHTGGAHVLLGTDTVKPGTLPGFSLHEEMENFVAAGMTPYEAIRAGTVDAAKFLHQDNEFGVVGAGRRADLLLVDANPLDDVKNVSKLTGVMINGRWVAADELSQRLGVLRASYRH
jgi:imidazolonepropionase-like amidohydrolase